MCAVTVHAFCVFTVCSHCKVHGRHVAVPRMVSGAYAQEYGQAEEIDRALHRVQVYNTCTVIIHVVKLAEYIYM